MPRKRFDHYKAQMDLRLTDIFMRAMTEQPFVNADTIWTYARRELLPPKEVTTRLAGSFRRYIASGYLKRTGRFATSLRNDSSPLPWYESTIYPSSEASLKSVPNIPFPDTIKVHGIERESQ